MQNFRSEKIANDRLTVSHILTQASQLAAKLCSSAQVMVLGCSTTDELRLLLDVVEVSSRTSQYIVY